MGRPVDGAFSLAYCPTLSLLVKASRGPPAHEPARSRSPGTPQDAAREPPGTRYRNWQSWERGRLARTVQSWERGRPARTDYSSGWDARAPKSTAVAVIATLFKLFFRRSEASARISPPGPTARIHDNRDGCHT